MSKPKELILVFLHQTVAINNSVYLFPLYAMSEYIFPHIKIICIIFGGPIPGNIQGQVGWCFEQPGPVEVIPAHCSGVRLDDP